MRWMIVALCLAALAGQGKAAAQPIEVSGVGTATLVVGDASDFLDGGFGGRLGVAVPVGSTGVLAFRGLLGLAPLDDVEAFGAGVARNSLRLAAASIEVRAPWRTVRPYAYVQLAAVGNRWDVTYLLDVPSDLGDDDAGTSWASGLGGGAGLLVRLGEAVKLDLAVEILDAGSVEFARFAGNEPRFPELNEVDIALLSLQLGLRLGVGGRPGS